MLCWCSTLLHVSNFACGRHDAPPSTTSLASAEHRPLLFAPAAPPHPRMFKQQLGVLMQHREACRSVLNFLYRLLDPGTALTKLQEQQQQRQLLGGSALDTSSAATALLQSQLDRVGPNLTRVLMGAVVGALPYSRVGDIAPVLQVRAFCGGCWCLLGGWVGVGRMRVWQGRLCVFTCVCFDVCLLVDVDLLTHYAQAMLKLGRDKAVGWQRDCMAAIPDIALTASDRDAYMAAAAAVLAGNAGMDGGCEGLEDALEVVSDLCRRNKRATRGAQVALLPAPLHGVLGLNA